MSLKWLHYKKPEWVQKYDKKGISIKPTPPPIRLIMEGIGELDICPICGSSRHFKYKAIPALFGIGRTKYCVQPKCVNGFRNEANMLF